MNSFRSDFSFAIFHDQTIFCILIDRHFYFYFIKKYMPEEETSKRVGSTLNVLVV